MTKLRHYDNLGTARFVTISCYHNYNLLRTDFAISVFLKYLNIIRQKYDIKLFGYVIMPNHAHLVLLPPDNCKLGRIIGELKSLSAKEILAHWRNKGYKVLDRLSIVKDGNRQNVFWQKRFYDHNCRTSETVIEKIKYCHKNPVVRNLVTSSAQWRWSSYRWYNGMDGVEIEIDGVEL